MTAQELKNSILQYAVQGKLVPQNLNDEPASELLKKIKAEKERLIKNKVIKKDKPLLPIKEEDKPFEIPESWEWVRFSDIVNYTMGKTPPRKEAKYWGEASYKWVSIADLMSDSILNNTKECVNEYSYLNIFKKKIIPKGTLLMSFKLTVGKVSILGVDAFHNEAIISIFPFIDTNKITTKYLFKCLPLLSKLGDTKSAIKGNTLNSDSLNNLNIPLPPLAEQQRIVDKIEELLPLVEQYGTAEVELNQINTKFPEQLKKSVLQYAVQGKLIPQNPQDETATVLLEKIKAEKKQLIKDKKIKQDKPLPEIKEEEIPFEIPDSWVWVRLGDVVQVNPRNKIEDDLNVSFIPMTLISSGYENQHTSQVKKWKDIKSGFTHFAEGDIGIAKITPCFENRKSVVFNDLSNGFGAGTTELHILRTYSETIDLNYLLYFCKTEMFINNGVKTYTGTAGQQRIGKDYITNCLFPLPPLSEQKLIVEKVEEVLRYCEKLKS